MLGTWFGGNVDLSVLDDRILHDLTKFPISTTERLAITQCEALARPGADESGAYQALFMMNNLHTLALIDYLNLSFILALNPDKNTSNIVVCPKLEDLVLFFQGLQEESCIDELLEMAKGRASRGAKLSTIVIICPRELIPTEKVSDLRRYVSCVEYRLDNTAPRWDVLPGEADKDYRDSDW